MTGFRLILVITVLLVITLAGGSAAQEPTVSTDSLYFTALSDGVAPAAQTFEVLCSICSTGFAWQLTVDVAWLDIVPIMSENQTDTVAVTVNSTDFTPGLYLATITIEGPFGHTTEVKVVYQVTGDIDADPDSLHFSAYRGDALPAALSFTLSCNNSGTTVNFWTVTDDAGWLEVSPYSGFSYSEEIAVSVNTTDLSPSLYDATITISSTDANNDPQHVKVTYLVHEHDLYVEPDSLHFSVIQGEDLPASLTFNVHYDACGSPTEDWQLMEGADWLEASPVFGGGGVQAVEVNITTTDLSPGDYLDTISIVSTCAGNSPVSVVVTLHITPADIIIDPDSLHFFAYQGDDLPASLSFNLSCNNSGTMFNSWTITDDAAWLGVSPTYGTATSAVINVSPNTTDLTPGLHEATITVSSIGANNHPQTAKVTYEIVAPDLTVDPDSLHFAAIQRGGLPSSLSFSVTYNACGSPAEDWTLSEDIDWLEASPIYGGGGVQSVEVSVISTDLSPGDHSGYIIVSSECANNSPESVLVTYHITPGDIIANPDSLYFAATQNEALPPALSFNLSCNNSGTSFNYWTIVDDADWLDVSPHSGTEYSRTIDVSVNTTGLTIATHEANITIASDLANNTPQTVKVVYVVTENQPPGPFVKLLPEDSAQLSALDINFAWAEPDDPDADELSYILNINIAAAGGGTSLAEPASDTTITTSDTSYTFNFGHLPGVLLDVHWTVWATDGYFFVEAGGGEWYFQTDNVVGVDDPEEDLLPTDFYLSQNYPNPFNPSTSMDYSLPERSYVTLTVYNILGQRVCRLVDGERAAGTYRVEWNGTDDRGREVVSGVYLYRLEAGSYSRTRRMLFIK